ncbi:fluoride efflux transporter CrcB [Anaerocolumna xylanovorans]|uniref:Fluoride-specific ion channel FluC n=1 Tax=Anaerocolumna xylanovorans DSM 12503 TaxID=1121345 RepID=A0A1M7Y1H3_9FIRM|nr:fluoride efflux transporter CrcB [Anaerocolumna xylanovorans]SHO45585.1 CrcB protein [Anaerocolumna xylanovorans DSM 12503]
MKKYLLLFLFGMGGAICRYGIGLLFHETFPWGTFSVNIIGCILLPIVLVFMRETKIISKEYITIIGTGFIGAFTTFSSFIADIITLSNNGKKSMAIIYLFVSLAGGLIATSVSLSICNYAVDKYLKRKG